MTVEVMGVISEAIRGSLKLIHAPSAAEFGAIYRALDEDTARVAGPAEWRPLAVLLLDASGSTVGGLWGRIAYRWLVIEMLFVPGPMRRRGFGSALVRTAEAEARRRGCVGMQVSRFDFQAPSFYENLGFAVFGVHDELPPGHRCFLLSKRLDQAEAEIPRLLDQARELAAMGRYAAAKAAYLDVLCRDPTHLAALKELAALAYAGGHRSAARTAYQQALRWHPQDAELAASRAHAIGILRKAVESDPLKPDGHQALGSALLHNGQFAAAASALAQAIALKPDFALAYRDLGHAFDRQGLDTKAMEAFQKALALSPKLMDVLIRLGGLHEAHGNPEEAVTCFERASTVAPDTTTGRLCQAMAMLLRGNTAAAESLLRKTLALNPGSASAHNVLGSLLVSAGRFQEGIEHYEAALRLNPILFGSWTGIARARKCAAADDPLLDRMRSALARDGLGDEERMALSFALGKAHDDLGNYAEAMRHFNVANDIRGRSLKLDRGRLVAWVDRMIERFTPEQFARLTAHGTADETPLFIVGMPRSGTTLIEQIVTSHPAIAAGDELSFWPRRGAAWEDSNGADLTEDAAHGIAVAYLALLRQIGPTVARVTDKLPFNFRWLGLTHTLLPDARIIHCRRHPVDTCLSIYSIPFRSKFAFVGSKADLVFFYRQYVRLMDHWRAVLPAERFLEVDYERLIADREAETRRLIAYTGLDWDAACLRPERNPRVVGTASAWQARQPVYETSVERWRHYEPWLGEFRELLELSE
jgi:tetratricopeptide (TPR) repeat protein